MSVGSRSTSSVSRSVRPLPVAFKRREQGRALDLSRLLFLTTWFEPRLPDLTICATPSSPWFHSEPFTGSNGGKIIFSTPQRELIDVITCLLERWARNSGLESTVGINHEECDYRAQNDDIMNDQRSRLPPFLWRHNFFWNENSNAIAWEQGRMSSIPTQRWTQTPRCFGFVLFCGLPFFSFFFFLCFHLIVKRFEPEPKRCSFLNV